VLCRVRCNGGNNIILNTRATREFFYVLLRYIRVQTRFIIVAVAHYALFAYERTTVSPALALPSPRDGARALLTFTRA